MSYSHYTMEELASDHKFRRWVLTPDPESTYFWEKWLLAHSEKQGIVAEARAMVLAFAEKELPVEEEDLNVLWDRIESSVEEHEEQQAPGDTQAKVLPLYVEHTSTLSTSADSRPVKRWLNVAAAIIGLTVLSLFMVYKIQQEREAILEELIVKEVPKGQKLKMFLPDGSEVIMNSSSTIKYPRQFNAEARVVELSGEAFFEVKRDSLAPFIVKCGMLETKVLGTSFNIEAYPGSEKASVALITGKVVVHTAKSNKETTLVPGEQINVDVASGASFKEKLKDTSALGWKDGILVFKGQPLKDVFSKLERWYGVNIQADNVPDSQKVTGVFENEYLSNVLESIQYSVMFDYSIKGDSVFIKF